MQDKTLSIGEIAEQCNVRVETIRYYERIGLVPAPTRTKGNQRAYANEHVDRLRFIRRARGLGFSILEIAELLGLSKASPTCRTVKALTEANLRKVRSKIEELRGMEATLSELVKHCPGDDTTDCVIINSLGSAEENYMKH